MHYLHKICKVSNSTVMVSLAVQPGCVYRDINMKWGGGGSEPHEVLVSSQYGLGKPFPPASPSDFKAIGDRCIVLIDQNVSQMA